MRMTDEIRKHIKEQLTAVRRPAEKPNVQRRTSAGLWARPFHSSSLGINPSQREEAIANLRAQGVTADFDAEGRCIVTSEKQYRDVAKAIGLWNGTHGYGYRNEDGSQMVTGREGVRRREEFKRQLLKECQY